MTEQKWVDENMTGVPRSWDDIIISGRRSLKTLEDGELKDLFNEFETLHGKIEAKLRTLNYEAG